MTVTQTEMPETEVCPWWCADQGGESTDHARDDGVNVHTSHAKEIWLDLHPGGVFDDEGQRIASPVVLLHLRQLDGCGTTVEMALEPDANVRLTPRDAASVASALTALLAEAAS